MGKYSFSGHESFVCKQFWLKKGYDFVKRTNKGFEDETAVVELGVGKNMVTSIRHWLKSFGLIDDKNSVTSIADYLFQDKTGKDPYLEDYGSIWMLHYLLVKSERASIYNLVFNEFRKERYEFTKEQLHLFLKRKCEEGDFNNIYNENTINSDIAVFLRNYLKPDTRTAESKLEIEEDFSSLLIDLDLVKHYRQKSLVEKKSIDWYN